jgi:hypothetical protein
VTFRLDEHATVIFSVQRAVSGHESGGRCQQRPGHSHRKAKRCTIWRTLSGSFRVTGDRGTNRFTFTGRIGGRTLASGRYRLVARPRPPAGSPGKPVRARFSIRI